MQIDNPRVRKITTCPICHEGKERGNVCCWTCWRQYQMKYGNPIAEQIIADYERSLAKVQS